MGQAQYHVAIFQLKNYNNFKTYFFFTTVKMTFCDLNL